MKQTAVEFIFEELENRENGSYSFTMEQIYNKAKEMEKQQIGEAYEDGYSDSDNTFELNKEYYNNKFKNK
jgi:hypothetical protein